MDNKIDLTQIEKELKNINLILSQKNEEHSITVPQLEKIENALNNVKQITVQNDKPIQIEYINNPSRLDYMTAWGTVGAVVISLLLGIIIPFIQKCIDYWKNRTKIKLKFIEYHYNKDKNILPTFFIDFKNLYEYQLYIKKAFFFIEFKGRVLPIILRLQPHDIAIIPPLSETEMIFSISSDICKDNATRIHDEEELVNFINKNHMRRNKVSPYDKIKSVYLSLDTNLGQFKINIPQWLRDNTSDSIIYLFMKDDVKFHDKIESVEDTEKVFILGMIEFHKKYCLGKKNRRKELWKWRIEEICSIIPFGGTFFDKFIYNKTSEEEKIELTPHSTTHQTHPQQNEQV